MEKRKQASRTPNASRNRTARSMSEHQGVRGLLNLAAAFGVREACFRFGLSHAKMRFGIARTAKVKSCFCFRFNANGPGGAPFRPAQKLRCSLHRLPAVDTATSISIKCVWMVKQLRGHFIHIEHVWLR